ncbi:hypothetical protein AC579_3955 [Pseudocercospora musae]|uniref:Guanine nucleotide-binding protein-like 3 N-terminal domain-containing protein n=1 Tax=Pseudocercospora musae TaxID=113226 RepID=A0A139I063_9PEZI|nr:hypothetical protein AC579_3955 [Pseudocercospora musae]
MKVGKPQSKRVPVRLRHKIQKASANKQRKARKDAKKNPQWRSRLKKDPGIPNLFPYKDKVLAEIEESKRMKEQEKLRKRELARAQREGKRVTGEVVNEEELDDADEVEDEHDEDMEDDEGGISSNPMAALVASAQARARSYTQADDDDEDDGENEDEEEFSGFQDKKKSAPTKPKAGVQPPAPKAKLLPKSVLADPIKPVALLIMKLSATQTGIQQLLDYYKLPPLVTAGSDTTTRFLIDVARKKGRLGPGGVPSLNGAALAVLGDLNEGRLKLDLSAQPGRKLGDVVVVQELGEAFKIEGLFGDEEPSAAGGKMEAEA